MFNANMNRWIITSINKHFQDRSEGISIYTDRHNQESDWAEIRIAGPTLNEYTRDCFEFECIINILITSFVDSDDYQIHRICGTLVKAFTPICCYRFGDGPQDDQTLIGTMILQPDDRGKVDVVHFGLITESNFRRSFIEAYYHMIL